MNVASKRSNLLQHFQVVVLIKVCGYVNEGSHVALNIHEYSIGCEFLIFVRFGATRERCLGLRLHNYAYVSHFVHSNTSKHVHWNNMKCDRYDLFSFL